MLFEKWSIDIAIQSQAFSVNKLITYITLHKQKTPIYEVSHSKAPKHGKFRLSDVREKPVDFFYTTARASTFAPAIILRT